MNAIVNRRIERTRKLLNDFILQLVVEKSYEQITVEEITERANLGRTTFYLHYKDKNELLEESLGQLLDALFQEIYSDENIRLWKEEGKDPRRIVFVHAGKNADLYRLLFRGEVGGIVLHHFRTRLTVIFNQIAENWQKILNISPELPNPVTTNYASGALIGLLIWWLESEMPHSPEEVYDMYYQLMIHGTAKGMGLPTGPDNTLV